ncbi:CYTH and CHAD domain-containing protein [Streptomyces spectabilis]|uniref:CHAD domain-containing protein n=1 Tax=Streptomyces spectabilis TaxID=68270 RepID=A0A5P2X4R0_STRST|nr:CYTH and CHAD domain-containing protein [Streptomyces spectabilis]MBB5109059.1 CHAD domain-containing protein [Streptomyces spectabilis]MCI3902702.1 CYTH and CHAD domain-containing protein [Streptomyces spectabilis]QEV60007.1 CHAD domain-containing protein [Streptomyces spectabilis]GGV44476.1 CHAD domain-containing protein [Streptomyces spectabilis]
MADTKHGTATHREIERKYDAGAGGGLPDLSGVAGVADVIDKGVADLDAVYYDTADQRLAEAAITLRRRTGGSDAGWHLKLPVSLADGVRDEVHAPLSDDVPRPLAGLVRSRVRDTPLAPVVRLRSARAVRHLVDESGTLLAEVSLDEVRAERLSGGDRRTTAWSEIEVELADGGDPRLLDRVEKKLRKAGVRRSTSGSKLARALAETGDAAPAGRDGWAQPPVPSTGDPAGAHVMAYLREQRDALIAMDPAVRQDLPDSVHQMRVATRRLRSAFKTYRKILDRETTDPLGEELRWLAGELGVDRDREVLTERLTTALADVPRTLRLGPVRARLRIWSIAGRAGSRRKTVAVLDSSRYLALLDAVDALLADPPLRKAAGAPADDALPKAMLKDFDRLAARVDHALALAPGEERDTAMHEARKAAKRARYAGEAAKPALGKPAKRFAKRMKAVQKVLGEHQDSVVAREALRNLAIQAHAAGESAYTWGLLYGREEAAAAAQERELPEVWDRAAASKVRAALGG